MRDMNDDELNLALRFSDVVLPEHAVDCEPWEWHDDSWRRLFTVQEWQVAAVLITVSGEQTHLGAVMHWMYVGGEDQFDGSGSLALMLALVGAGTLLHSLNLAHPAA